MWGAADDEQTKAMVRTWLHDIFDHYYKAQPPQSTLDYYFQQLSSGAIQPSDVEAQIVQALKASKPSQQQPQQPQQQPPTTTTAAAVVVSQTQTERITEYVDLLYSKFCGSAKKADVASRSQLIKKLVAGSMTLAEAEWTVQYSPEAKKFAAESRREKLRQYVMELAKCYLHQSTLPENEIIRLVNDAESGKMTLQDVEDDFKLKALQ